MEILKYSTSAAYRQRLWDWKLGTNINTFQSLIKNSKELNNHETSRVLQEWS